MTMSVDVSVVTVNLNNAEGLQKTICSVKGQRGVLFEHIIIDGLSADGSMDVVKRCAYPGLLWKSGKDKGIYDGMNKGITMASGKYLIFLNSGDEFCSEMSLKILLQESCGADIVYGNLAVQNGSEEKIFSYPSAPDLQFMTCNGLPHPSTLIKRQLMATVGYYDISYRISGDWVFFMLALFKYSASYKHVNTAVSRFYTDGVSSDKRNLALILREHRRFLRKEFPGMVFYFNRHSMQSKRLLRTKPRWARPVFILRNFLPI